MGNPHFGKPAYEFYRDGKVNQSEGRQCEGHRLFPPSVGIFQKYSYLEGQRDLVSRFIIGITWVIIWLIGGLGIRTRPPM